MYTTKINGSYNNVNFKICLVTFGENCFIFISFIFLLFCGLLCPKDLCLAFYKCCGFAELTVVSVMFSQKDLIFL